MEDSSLSKLRWHHTWWGVTLAGFGALIVVFTITIAATTLRYWWQIKHGQLGVLQQRFGSGFTASLAGGAGASKIDRTKLETSDDPYLGRPGAPTVIVEFADFKCPNCKVSAPILHQVAKKFGAKAKIIIRDFPAESIHPGATILAQVAYCAGQQNHYWQMHDALYENQDILSDTMSVTELASLADKAGIDFNELQKCYTSPEAVQEVKRDYLDGISFGARGTPTFFINGEKVEGTVPFAAWERYLGNVK